MKFNRLAAYFFFIMTVFILNSLMGLQAKTGSGDTYQRVLEDVYNHIRAKEYTSANEILIELKDLYPSEPEIYYLLSYLSDRYYKGWGKHNISGPAPIDMEYANLLMKVNELDPDYDPAYLQDLDNEFFFSDAHTKLTSHLGLCLLQASIDKDYDTASRYIKICEEGGGYTNELLEYNANILNSCEDNAIVFSNGDMDTIPGWYLQTVENKIFKGYKHSSREVFPTQKEKDAMQAVLNERTQHEHGIRRDIAIVNLSLLNTAWYVKYVRDDLGVRFTQDIDNLFSNDYEMLWSIDVSIPNHPNLDFYYDIPEDSPWDIESGYITSDLAVYQIIRDNYGKRSIYFAITCATFLGLENHLRAEGMVGRLVASEEEGQIDTLRMSTNLDQVYKFEWASLKGAKYSVNTRSLLQNYGSVHVKMALEKVKQGKIQEAEAYITKAKAFVDQEIKLTEFYVAFYSRLGQWDKLDSFIEKNILGHSKAAQIFISYVDAYIYENYPAQLSTYLEKGMKLFPADSSMAEAGLIFAENSDNPQEIRGVFLKVQDYLEYDLKPFLDELDGYSD